MSKKLPINRENNNDEPLSLFAKEGSKHPKLRESRDSDFFLDKEI